MAISVDYVLRETATNLRRNLLMSTAAVLTVAVSLFLVGGSLLLQQSVNKVTVQWRGGVELNIFLNPDIAQTQRDGLQAELAAIPEVKKVSYVDQEAAYDEFKQMFVNSPDMVESVTAKDLPPSFRVVPREPELVESIGERFQKREGVKEVVYAKETVDTLLKVTYYMKWGIRTIAAVLLLSALLLILNTIRMAIFARRREVAVMKLVGATNWFIRIPFMLEGMFQGIVGAGFAILFMWFSRTVIERIIEENSFLGDFVVTGGDVLGTGLFVLAVGAIVGGVGSAIAVSRFLDV
jgi:cell division transport system permease protein